ADAANIMTKMFYIVVPYEPPAIGSVKSAIPFLKNSAAGANTGFTDSFDEYRVQLEQRMSLVSSGIAASGVRAAALGTEEIIELLYRSFNLGELESPIRAAQGT